MITHYTKLCICSACMHLAYYLHATDLERHDNCITIMPHNGNVEQKLLEIQCE